MGWLVQLLQGHLAPDASTLYPLGAPSFAIPVLMAMLPSHFMKRRIIFLNDSSNRAKHYSLHAFP